MSTEVNEMVQLFLRILHAFSLIEKKPWDLGTGSKIYLTEIQTVSAIDENPDTNMSQLADIMGVTRGAISQTVRKLVAKKLVIRSQSRNNKEVNLTLTGFGLQVSQTYRARMQEVFTFADELYDSATPDERELVKNLFHRIHANMKTRII